MNKLNFDKIWLISGTKVKAPLFPDKVEVIKYTDDIDQYYQKASVIISSAGAGSIAELSQYKKKIILFPNKTSKYNHQMINASYADFALLADNNDQILSI